MPAPAVHPPVMPYRGLSIVLNRPSRFDTDRLISGRAGDYFNNILTPFNRHCCEIRTAASLPAPPLPGTKLTLLLGQEALDKFLPNKDIRTVRGSTFSSGGNLYLPTFTPQDSFDQRNYENPANPDAKEDEEESDSGSKDVVKTRRKNYRFWLYQDVRKALRLVQFGLRSYPKVNYKIYRPATEIEQALLSYSGGKLVVDIETDRNLNMTCFGFCFYPHDELRCAEPIDVYVVPFKLYTGQIAYEKLAWCKILRGLFLAFKRNLVIGHNLAFDLFILAAKYRIPFPAHTFCTMIGQHRRYPEVEKSLGHVVSLYTDLPFHKDEGIFAPNSSAQEQQLWLYNGKDVATTLFVYLGMIPRLQEAKALESAQAGAAQQKAYLTMQYEGCPIDKDVYCKTIDGLALRIEQLQRLLNLAVGFNLNPGSWKQVARYLYGTADDDDTEVFRPNLGLPRPEYDSTSEDTLHKMYIRCGAPSIRVILAIRESRTLRSKLANTLLWRGDRLTCAYKNTGSDMHRLGSSKLLKFKGVFDGWGTNMQNFHKSLRHVIVAPKGFKFSQIDQSGADAKIVAYLCPNEKFRGLFINGIKPHTFVAMHIAPAYWATRLGIPSLDDYIYAPIDTLKNLPYWKDLSNIIAESENHPEPQFQFYKIGKTMCHSLNFNASWAMFQIIALKRSDGTLRFTNEQAQRLHKIYTIDLFSELQTYWNECQEMWLSNGRILRNLFGYPREFGGFKGHELFKQLYAFIPQSTVACITHLAATEIQRKIDEGVPLYERVSLLQNGHDSLLLQAPEDTIIDVSKDAKTHMARHLVNFRGERFQMGAGVSIGGNWGPADDKKNPDGLVERKDI